MRKIEKGPQQIGMRVFEKVSRILFQRLGSAKPLLTLRHPVFAKQDMVPKYAVAYAKRSVFAENAVLARVAEFNDQHRPRRNSRQNEPSGGALQSRKIVDQVAPCSAVVVFSSQKDRKA